MCELTAKKGKQKVMEEIVRVIVNENSIICYDSIGNKREFKGKLKEVNMNKQEIIIEELL